VHRFDLPSGGAPRAISRLTRRRLFPDAHTKTSSLEGILAKHSPVTCATRTDRGTRYRRRRAGSQNTVFQVASFHASMIGNSSASCSGRSRLELMGALCQVKKHSKRPRWRSPVPATDGRDTCRNWRCPRQSYRHLKEQADGAHKRPRLCPRVSTSQRRMRSNAGRGFSLPAAFVSGARTTTGLLCSFLFTQVHYVSAAANTRLEQVICLKVP
jgi:hypothetical protein